MPKLKCIGGEADDRYWYIDEYRKIGDLVQVAKFPVMAVAFDPDEPPEIMYTTNLAYRIAVFNFSKDDKYMFLVSEYPIKMSDKEAILHQFNKVA